MNEEKDICYEFFLKSYGNDPDFKLISEATLIN